MREIFAPISTPLSRRAAPQEARTCADDPRGPGAPLVHVGEGGRGRGHRGRGAGLRAVPGAAPGRTGRLLLLSGDADQVGHGRCTRSSTARPVIRTAPRGRTPHRG
ncbi:hypothetical protein QJS66_09355 [Kocuria rhizophila]|nr:hypothetical protein QJS66_09355 [Kocuria rhizophila]